MRSSHTSWTSATPVILIVTAVALVGFVLPTAIASEPVMPPEPEDRAKSGPMYNITVRVLDNETGEPVQEARVGARSGSDDRYHGYAGGEPDEDGRVTLSLPEGEVTVRVDSHDYAPYRLAFRLTDNTTLPDVRLDAPPEPDVRVTGRVTDEDGNPIPDARVSINTDHREIRGRGDFPSYPLEGNDSGAHDLRRVLVPIQDWNNTKTNEDGSYALLTHEGPKRINVRAPDHVRGEVAFNATGPETTVDTMRLEKVPAADAVLEGTVVDDTGAPVEGAQVNVHTMEWSRWNSTRTDENGVFSLHVVPGYARVDVTPRSGDPDTVHMAETVEYDGNVSGVAAPDAPDIPERERYRWSGTLVVASGEANTLDVTLKTRPGPTLVLEGYILDAGAETGIPNAHVSIRNLDTGERGRVITDEHGSYRFHVRPGELVLEARAGGYFENVRHVTVAEGAAPLRVDLALTEGEEKYAPCGPESCPHYRGSHGVYSAPVAMEAAVGYASDSGGQDTATASSSAPEYQERESRYHGEGGGLGPYTAASTEDPEGDNEGTNADEGDGETDPDGHQEPTGSGLNEAPFPAPLAGLGLVAIAALLRRRQ